MSRVNSSNAPHTPHCETKDGFVLEAERPGANKEGLEISLEGNALTLVEGDFLEASK